MTRFTHPNYDGKHWVRGSAESAMDNELNRLNKQIKKFVKAGATNSSAYKKAVENMTRLSNNNIKWVNGVPQAKRGAQAIADAVKAQGNKQFKNIQKSKNSTTFEMFKKVAKKNGLTPNEASLINNQSALYYEALYADDLEGDEPLDLYDDTTPEGQPKGGYGNGKLQPSNPHSFEHDDYREIFLDDVIIHSENGFINVETGEYFDNETEALKSFDETTNKIKSGDWFINTGHWNENIDWSYYNQFKRKKWL